MKRARCVAAARREFLTEVLYYNDEESGLGARFAPPSKKRQPGQSLFRCPAVPPQRPRVAFSSKTFHLRSCIDRVQTESSCLPWRNLAIRLLEIADEVSKCVGAVCEVQRQASRSRAVRSPLT